MFRMRRRLAMMRDVLDGLEPPRSMLDAVAWKSMAVEQVDDGGAGDSAEGCNSIGTFLACDDSRSPVSEQSTDEDLSELARGRRIRGALVKTMKKNKIRSIIDVPCSANARWMPELLVKLDFDIPGLKYYCIDDSEEKINSLRQRFTEAGNPEFIARVFWRQQLPPAQLVLTVDSIQYMSYANAWSFMLNLKQSGVKYIMLESSVNLVNEPEPHVRDHLNVLKSPFRFKEPQERFSNVTAREDGLMSDLFFYHVMNLPLTV